MTFGRSVSTCLRKYFVLSGRASRSEYWWFSLASLLIGLGLTVVDLILYGLRNGPGPIEMVGNLLVICPNFTVSVRRLHDVGRSGWFLLVPLAFATLAIAFGAMFGPTLGSLASVIVGVTIACGFLLLLWWYFRPSTPGSNRYGPNPLEVTQ